MQAMTKHLLKTPDERKQPTRAASAKGPMALSKPKGKPTGGGRVATAPKSVDAKWAVTELLDVSDFDTLVPCPATASLSR